MRFRPWLEAVQYPDEFLVHVEARYIDQPTLTIDGWGSIRLFYSGSPFPHWVVHMIQGSQPGAGVILYFAALWWALTEGDKSLVSHKEKPTHGQLASDSTLSPDAIRARIRMQQLYGEYLYIDPHPNADSVKVHRGDRTDWRRAATHEEAALWRLKKAPPFGFRFV